MTKSLDYPAKPAILGVINHEPFKGIVTNVLRKLSETPSIISAILV